MKFTDGYWDLKEGVALHGAVEVEDYTADDRSLTVYAACRRVEQRGHTLNEPLLTVRFSSPRADVIRVSAARHLGQPETKPEFRLNGEAGHGVRVCVTDETLSFSSGRTEARVQRAGPWKVQYFYDGRLLTGSQPKALAHLSLHGKPYMREQLDLGVGELVYGLGERFTPYVKNGQSVDIWNEDGGTSSDIAYKNIPFYVSNRGYGVFVNHPERVSFEIGTEVVSRAQFSVGGERLDYCVVGGGTPKEALRNYALLTGMPALPPAWSFGLWLTTSFTTSYDEDTVTGFVDGMASRGIPLSVFHFDCFWMKAFQWCDFTWDSDVFPDPEGMLRRLKAKGLRICVWINPYIAQKSRLFAEGMERGFLLKRADGSVWQWDKWQAGMALVDFTNPGAVAWYQDKLKALLDMGVDCFKTDFGERVPTDVSYFDGSDPVRMHNYYALLYNRAVFELLERERGKTEAVLFARSATAGGQQYPVHWGGDCIATYPSMAESLRGGLSLTLSGFSFWSHDIGGFDRTASPDLFKRWIAFGLLSSHSRLHGNDSYRVPWNFDEESVDVLRFFTRLKCSLMPTVFAAACASAAGGVPVMRAMMLEFPSDPMCGYLDRQYMLGDSLLVAPVFSAEGDVEYYVPEGTWTNFLTGEAVQGGRWVRERHGYLSVPLLARPCCVVAVGAETARPDYDYADGVTFHVFEVPDGGKASAAVHGPDGSLALTAEVSRSGKVLTVRVSKPGNWKVLLRGVQTVAGAEGAQCLPQSSGALLAPAAGGTEITVRL